MDFPFPKKGLNDDQSFEDQGAETTRDSRNMRGIDPTNGRKRGAQRAGQSKHHTTRVASSPLRSIRSVVYDNKTVTYTELQGELDPGAFGALSEEWAEKTGANTAARNVALDSAGSVYLVTGQSIEKRNADGTLLWTFPVPVTHDSFVLGPLAVGADLAIHVAVESGTVGPEGAAVYRIRQAPVANSFDTEPKLEWTWITDNWVREIRLNNGELKILEQDDPAAASYVATLTSINSAVPVETSRARVPYPSTCMVIRPDGSSITGHPFQTNRDSQPLFPGVGLPLEAWTIDNLDNATERVWCDLRAEDIQGLADGDLVNLLGDRSGHGRAMYGTDSKDFYSGFTLTPPTYREKGSTGSPSIYFDGSNLMTSLSGGGTEPQKDACKTMVPNHGDGAFCTFIVCRPDTSKASDEVDEDGAPVDARRWLFDQLGHTQFQGAGTAGNYDFGYNEDHRSSIFVNSSVPSLSGFATQQYTWSGKNDKTPGDWLPGYARCITSASGFRGGIYDGDGQTDTPYGTIPKGAGDSGWPLQAQFDNSSADTPGEGITLFTFMHCGGLDELAATAVGIFVNGVDFVSVGAFSHMRVGAPVDIFNSTGVTTDTGTVADADTITLTSSSIPSDTDATAHVRYTKRNDMSRSLWRVNGKPIDRWEALPMSYAGADGSDAAVLDKSVTSNPTSLGAGRGAKDAYPFKGEIMQIITIGRRLPNSDGVVLGGTRHHLEPAVIEHPKYATYSNAATDIVGDTDAVFEAVTQNLNSTDLEKVEGWLMARHGISDKLPMSNYVHPHYKNGHIPLSGAHDIPLVTNLANDWQSWPPRLRQDAAMICKHDQFGKMLWTLVSEFPNAGGVSNGDIMVEDIYGNKPQPLLLTQARPTSGLALGLEDRVYFAGPGEADGTWCMGYLDDTPDNPTDPLSPGIKGVGWWFNSGDPPDDDLKLTFEVDKTLRIIADEFNNLHVPCRPGTFDPVQGGAEVVDAMRLYDPDGDPLFRLTARPSGNTSHQNCYAIGIPPSPDYHI